MPANGVCWAYGKLGANNCPHVAARGRGKIEQYHKALHRELIKRVEFTSLSHFRRELRKFDRRYNNWRKQEIHGWKTPAEIYNNRRFFNKNRKIILSKSGHKIS